jgi:hypothetical protein
VNKQGNPQSELKRTTGPPSPSKGKATIQIKDKGERSKKKFDPLDTLDPEPTSNKEQMEENSQDLDEIVEIQEEDPDPQPLVTH